MKGRTDMNEWQLIETAPRDGSCILVLCRIRETFDPCHDFDIVYFDNERNFGIPIGWSCVSGGQPLDPTHWMPLPNPPES
jgi:hypothetical protein